MKLLVVDDDEAAFEAMLGALVEEIARGVFVDFEAHATFGNGGESARDDLSIGSANRRIRQNEAVFGDGLVNAEEIRAAPIQM